MDNLIACLGRLSSQADEVKILCEKVAVLSADNIDEVFSKVLILPENGRRNGNFKNGYNRTNVPAFYQSISQGLSQEMKVSIQISEPIEYGLSQLLRAAFSAHPGNYSLELIILRQSGVKQKIRTSFKVDNCRELIQKIEKIIGLDKVVAN